MGTLSHRMRTKSAAKCALLLRCRFYSLDVNVFFWLVRWSFGVFTVWWQKAAFFPYALTLYTLQKYLSLEANSANKRKL